MIYIGGYEGVLRGRLPSFDAKWRRYYCRSPMVSRVHGMFLAVVGAVLCGMGVFLFLFVARSLTQSR